MIRKSRKASPHCRVSLVGDALPAEVVAAITLDDIDDTKPDYGMSTYHHREIGIEIPGVSNGVLFWECPDCGGQWHRFDITSRMHHVALTYKTKPAIPTRSRKGHT